MSAFIGREKELERLQNLMDQPRSSMVVIKGRRRIGKSRLAIEFATRHGYRLLKFAGIAPDPKVTLKNQLDNFAYQLSMQIGSPYSTFNDWNEAFNAVDFNINVQPTVILLDEISWMGEQDPGFSSKIKNWWDFKLSMRESVMIVLCGSVSTWIEENIINSTALFGRISLILALRPFSLQESNMFLRLRGFKGSVYDIYKMLAITGGVPWYLEQISTKFMANENIQQLCFTPGGALVEEYDRIVNDLFNKKSEYYSKILQCLKDGMQTLHDVRRNIGAGSSGTISMYMDHLVTSGFVTKHSQWSLQTSKPGKQALYSLSDPYVRFYLKYIQPRLEQIESGKLANIVINSLPGFDIILSLQIETLLLQNRAFILKLLDIPGIECVQDNPYIQHATQRKHGCQIDYLIQTRSKNLFVCEFKFKLNEIKADIITEMRDKIKRFSVPRNYAVVPVLFHIGGVNDSVIESDYFYRIIDMATLLDRQPEHASNMESTFTTA